MKKPLRRGIESIGAGLMVSGMALAIAGCAHSKSDASVPTTDMSMTSGAASGSDSTTAPAAASGDMSAMPVQTSAPAQTPGQPGAGQLTFDSDQAAADALVAAAKNSDHDQMHQILGPAWKELLSGDKVADAKAFHEFAAHAAEHSRLDKKDDSTTILDVGADNWPYPIPIEKTADGKWFFDTEVGKTEILDRRIGDNELTAIDICHAYVRAQHVYFRTDHDGSGLMQYAQHILSDDGTQNGLYWPVADDQPQSPFGPFIAQADYEGYAGVAVKHSHTPYHGYYFHILKAQGADAPGGAYSYIINGHMVAGFALIAFPDSYRSSGVMTFIVNQNGKVYQKDLGADTTKLAWKTTEYDPDATWTSVTE
jgi:hypothetical protein